MLGVRRTGEAPGHGSVCETDAARTELLGVPPRFDRGALHGSPLDGDLVTARCGRGGSSSTTHQRAQHGGCQAEVGKGAACVCSIDPSSSSLPRAYNAGHTTDCRGVPGRG